MRASIKQLVIAALLLLVTSVSASAETLMMPKRDAKAGVPVVVWGVTTLPNGTAFTLDYGDATSFSGNVGDRSYIAFPHTYAAAGIYTATLTVGAESATVQIQVFDPGTMTPANLRNLGINMAIEDGLRYLWTSQNNRSFNFPGGTQTSWPTAWSSSVASLVVLSFQNHGYKLNNDGSAPTGLYEKYLVRRGLNYVLASLTTVGLPNQPAGNPCLGPASAAEFAAGGSCVGLRDTRHDSFHDAYTTSVALLAVAGSGALSRVNTEVGGYLSGKTYGEILQRLSNTLVAGQIDSGNGRGGWWYCLSGIIGGDGNCSFARPTDGSTVGWGILSLADAGAAGAIVPAFAKSEFALALANSHNNDGSLDYQGDGNPASFNSPGMAKGGIPLQGLFFTGQAITPGSKGEATLNYMSNKWNLNGTDNWWCNNWVNKGCGYAMFNAFKGLKLMGVTTLPGVTRPAGPGPIPANDWYADYQDWLTTNQQAANTTGGGHWGTMGFSCCHDDAPTKTAIAELILSPVALVLPDADKFASVGLSPATNSALELTTHTVTAHAESTGGTPVPGATVNFVILTGPNAGLTGTGTTDSNGEATFTYTDQGPEGTTGTDTIQASIGNLQSNIVEMTWTPINTAPVCTITPSQASIWPPNHKMVSITASGATDAEGGPLTYAVVSIFQDEPTNTNGDGNTAIDGAGIGTSTAQVRAERTGDPKNPGNGRVYHITFSVTDSLGLSCQATVTVGVPHDQSGKVQPIDDGALFDSTVAGPPPAAAATGKGKGN